MVSKTRVSSKARSCSKTARTTLSDIRCENDSLNPESIVGQASSRRALDTPDERGVACMYPLSEVGCSSDALNVNVDVVREILRHPEPVSADAREVACNPHDDEFE